MGNDNSRWAIQLKFIIEGKLVWFFCNPDGSLDMVRRDLTDEERANMDESIIYRDTI